MKRTTGIIGMCAIMTIGAAANASMNCSVLHESKPGQYTEVLASIDYDGSAREMLIYTENGISFSVGTDGRGSVALSAIEKATSKVFAAASAKTKEQIIALAPEIGRIITCVSLK